MIFCKFFWRGWKWGVGYNMKPATYTAVLVAVIACVLLAASLSPREAATRQPQPYSSGRAVDGLVSGGVVRSVQWGEPVVVTVPDSWLGLRESARDGYLLAIWGEGGKADVRVVDDRGVVLQVYTPPAGPISR